MYRYNWIDSGVAACAVAGALIGLGLVALLGVPHGPTFVVGGALVASACMLPRALWPASDDRLIVRVLLGFCPVLPLVEGHQSAGSAAGRVLILVSVAAVATAAVMYARRP